MIEIRPEARRRVDIREVWRFRGLLRSFCEREFRVRYKQTLLGPVWLIVQPLLQTLVFTVFMHGLVRVPSSEVPYGLFAYAGLLPWLFISNGVQSLSYGLMMNAHLASRVYFPRVIIPASMTLVRLVDFAVSTVLFLIVAAFFDIRPSWRLLLLPAVMAQAALLTFALGAWSSCLLSRYRDFGTLLPVILQAAMFASPVIYPSTLVRNELRPFYLLNPVSTVVDAFRGCVLGGPFPAAEWGTSLIVTAAIALACLVAFARTEQAAVEAL